MSEVIRVYITDDHPVVRRGIKQLLQTEEGIDVVGEATNGLEAIADMEKLKPDIVLMDLVMPVMDGIEATLQIKARHPEIQILVLTSFATDDKVFPAIKAGALGYLIKDTGPEELVLAIRQVHHGQLTLHPSIAQKLLKELILTSEQPPSPDPLTEREIEVVKLIARGLSNQEIADTLVVSVTTVYTHISRILDKLHLASRTQAALYALREGLASLYDDIG
ncbi:MAG: response regulator transcription factor [Anaerolineales bacterium]|nr:response regulator transcription factor [Anaerolineales bacterium]